MNQTWPRCFESQASVGRTVIMPWSPKPCPRRNTQVGKLGSVEIHWEKDETCWKNWWEDMIWCLEQLRWEQLAAVWNTRELMEFRSSISSLPSLHVSVVLWLTVNASWRGELLKRVQGNFQQQWVVLREWRSTWKVKQLKPGRWCLDAPGAPCRGLGMLWPWSQKAFLHDIFTSSPWRIPMRSSCPGDGLILRDMEMEARGKRRSWENCHGSFVAETSRNQISKFLIVCASVQAHWPSRDPIIPI